MDEIRSMLNTTGRDHSDSFSSDATQSTGSRAVLRHRLNQLLTCVDDMDTEKELQEKMSQSLDNAFSACVMRANKLRKKRFRWRMNGWLFYRVETRTFFIFLLLLSISPPIFTHSLS